MIGMRTSAGLIRYDIVVDQEKCKGCQKCIKSCSSGALYCEKKSKAELRYPTKCTGCGYCVTTCPFGAIGRTPRGKGN